MKAQHKSDYRQRRQAEYPTIEDQLDAIWKGGGDAEKMRKRVLAIKEKYPKSRSNKLRIAEDLNKH